MLENTEKAVKREHPTRKGVISLAHPSPFFLAVPWCLLAHDFGDIVVVALHTTDGALLPPWVACQ